MYQIYRSFLPHDVKVKNDSSGSRDWGAIFIFSRIWKCSCGCIMM